MMPFLLLAQTAPDKYWIHFTDKANTPYSISQPDSFLSAKSIQRRINQNIPIVENDLPVDPVYIDSLEALGLDILTRSKWMNAVTVHADSIQMIFQAMNFYFVDSYQKVLRLKTNMADIVDLTKDVNSLSLTSSVSSLDYGYSANQIEMLNCHILHNEGYTGQGMVIAILDAGFRNVDTLPAFDSLWANGQILGMHDFVSGGDSVFEDHTHGMMVLSCMGGNSPGELMGTAPGASYWLLRSEDVYSEYVIEEDNWVAAAEFADSVGADVLNTSLGYTEFDDPSQNHTYADMDGNTTRISNATDIAASKGMLVVNSAGNSGSNSWFYIGAPADADSVLAVGAVDENGNYVSFSSKGPSYDGRVKPNVAAKGQSCAVEGTNGAVTFGSGTSFASPIMAGAAACLWQAHPDLSNMQIFEAIEMSGSQASNPDSLMGYGIPNLAQAHLVLHNIEYSEFNEEAFFRVSPNPFTDFFKLEMYSIDSQNVSVEMFDIMGRKVFSNSFNVNYPRYDSVTIDNLSYLPTGIYVVKITTINRSYQVKVIKS